MHPHGFASVHYVWYARARTDALFLDGTNTAGGFKFAEFPPHRNHFYDFKLPVNITSPGVVSSDGLTLMLRIKTDRAELRSFTGLL